MRIVERLIECHEHSTLTDFFADFLFNITFAPLVAE